MSHCAKPCSTRTCLAQALTWQGTPSLCAFLGFMALMNGIIAAFFASASSFMYAKEGDPATAEDFVFWSGLSWLLVVIVPSAILALGMTSSWRIRGRSDGVIGLAMNVFVCALWMIVLSRYVAN